MLALPIALPAILAGQIDLETVKMKCEIDNALPVKFRSSLKELTLDVWGTFQFDKTNRFIKFSLSTERISKASFQVTFDNETFSHAKYTVEHQVVSAWLDMAIKRRISWGRELAQYFRR
jgi:hypothetical protein